MLKGDCSYRKAIWNTEQDHEIYKHHQKKYIQLPNTGEQFTKQASSSPKIMVVMATIWGSRQYLTLDTFKTLHADCAITRSNKDFGHICGAELHPPYKITSSLPLYEGSLIQHIIIPQDDVSTLGAHCNSGGMGGMPFQTSDPPIKGAGCAVKFVGSK